MIRTDQDAVCPPAALKTRFTPGMKDGKPVSVSGSLEFVLRLDRPQRFELLERSSLDAQSLASNSRSIASMSVRNSREKFLKESL
jgi:hypothetical protein